MRLYSICILVHQLKYFQNKQVIRTSLLAFLVGKWLDSNAWNQVGYIHKTLVQMEIRILAVSRPVFLLKEHVLLLVAIVLSSSIRQFLVLQDKKQDGEASICLPLLRETQVLMKICSVKNSLIWFKIHNIVFHRTLSQEFTQLLQLELLPRDNLMVPQNSISSRQPSSF